MSKVITAHYETLESAVAVGFEPPTPAWGDYQRESRTHNTQWAGTKSFEAAAALARTGWPDGLKNMVKNVNSLAAAPSLERGPSFYLDTGGAYPVAALAAAGAPDCMVNFAPVTERVRPIIRLAVPVMASAMYKAEAWENYGAGLVGIIDALESADYRVELTVFISLESYGKKALFTIRVKEAQDFCDLDKLAFALCHASMFRRIGFGVMEKHLDSKTWGGTYGIPCLPDSKDLPDMIILAGLQQFKTGGPELKSPLACFKAMLPVISEQLADRFADMPPLQFAA